MRSHHIAVLMFLVAAAFTAGTMIQIKPVETYVCEDPEDQ